MQKVSMSEAGSASGNRGLGFKGLPRVSIVVPFLVNQFYGWDPIIEILANQKKNYNGDYR